jgi:hypothetical protein
VLKLSNGELTEIFTQNAALPAASAWREINDVVAQQLSKGEAGQKAAPDAWQ